MSKVKIYFLSLTSILIFTFIFLITFQLEPQQLYICDAYINLSSRIFSYSFEFIYPTSLCDDKVYLNAVTSFDNLFSESNNQYQNRPLYLIIVFLIYKWTALFGSSIGIEISFLLAQVLLISISVFLLTLKLNEFYKIRLFEILQITIIFSLNPLVQFGLFTTSSQTTTLLVFCLTFYFYNKLDTNTQIYKIAILYGILFLLNRSFFVGFVFLLLLHILKNKKSIFYKILSLFNLLIFFLPNFIYKSVLKFNGILIYDINSEYYGQFIWVSKYFDSGLLFWVSKLLLPKKLFELRFKTNWNVQDEWYCQSIPENFICYFKDSLSLLQYLLVPTLLLLVSIFFVKNKSKYTNELTFLGISIYLFWSFIGWYPPIRFSLYSISNLIFLLLIVKILDLDNLKNKFLFLLIILSTTFHIDHWNSPEMNLLKYNEIISLLLVVFYVYKIFNDKSKKT